MPDHFIDNQLSEDAVMKAKLLPLIPLLFTTLSYAEEEVIDAQKIANTRCFTFELDSPQKSPEYQIQKVIGCYLPLEQDKELVFLNEEDGVNELTNAIVDSEGLIHFSQSSGVVDKVIQSPILVNPMPIPLRLKDALESETASEITPISIYTDRLKKQLNEFYEKATSNDIEAIEVNSILNLDDSEQRVESYYLPEQKQPRDGYWWPHNNVPLANGPSSPLAKYDRYVEKVTGKNPNSVEWEKANHHTGTIWAGHCNGWVASSILYGYFDKDLLDISNNQTITSSDIQGMRSATSYCARVAFMGTRYVGPQSNLEDITPDEFHKNLVYYIKFLKKPVSIDYLSMVPVDNHIVSGYEFTYRKEASNKFRVTAKLKIHGYNYTYVSVNRVAKPYTINYAYYLWKNSRGEITKARWVDSKHHPDFMWVPLSEVKCAGENPRMDHKMVDHMIKNLKPTRFKNDSM